jgi:4,5-dihydroxyphthalate decarboxylase
MDNGIVKVACRRHDWTAALFDNKVRLPSLHLEIAEQANVGVGELLRNRDLDFAECGLAGFLRARSSGASVRALPVFIRCAFRHSYIFVHAGSGIQKPKDLEGKRVGTTYGMTANVWARGLLAHEYGVRLAAIRWVNAETEDSSYLLPPGMQLEYVPKDTDLQEWLVAGKIDALVHPDLIPAEILARKNVKRLFPDAAEEEKKSYRHSGVIPVMNIIACREEYLERLDVVREMFQAFCQAKELGLEKMQDSRDSGLLWYWDALEKQMALAGRDPVPYSVEKSRRTLQTFVDLSVEQGLIRSPIRLEDLFFGDLQG